MPSNDPLSAEQIEQFREQLRDLRDRLLSDVDNASEAIREEINPAGNLSNAPIHLADSADGQVDADIQIVENEREMLEEVQAGCGGSTTRPLASVSAAATRSPRGGCRCFLTPPSA